MEYIHAARTAGFSSFHILLRHVIPNTAHLMLINFSLLLIGAIKSEVILSFLGLGVKGQPSWGIMIRDAGNNGDVVTGFFWEIGTATVLMFGLVLAFNILSDALQDAFDPKHV
jgi:peptide/nickel transport system permease protein